MIVHSTSRKATAAVRGHQTPDWQPNRIEVPFAWLALTRLYRSLRKDNGIAPERARRIIWEGLYWGSMNGTTFTAGHDR